MSAPAARLVTVSTPEQAAETEAEFYKRRYRELAKELYDTRQRLQLLELSILELLEEAES